ncbi:MAG: PRC-barrel domain-containing protein [Acidaminococcales bacterium]|jgi:uncharacterized protein YrrD|nr:PRC-barrel domain-containing protein [Acidaminococcales bacterium]
MKESAKIIGLPIVSLVDGKEVGTVKSLLIDAAEAAIAAIAVEDGTSYKGAKLVRFGDILGIGERALTIEDKSIVNEWSKVPELEKFLEANVNVINTEVLSKKGHIKGKIVEVYFDLETGKIVECHAKTAKGNDFTITADRIYTLAAKRTIIAEEDEDIGSKPVSAPVPAAKPAAALSAFGVPDAPPDVSPATPPAAADEENSGDAAVKDATKKFEDRQRTFMIGKKANRKIVTDNGVEIINPGEEVTDEVIQRAKAAGKFVELSMSLQ